MVLSDSLLTVVWVVTVIEGFRRLERAGGNVIGVTALVGLGALLLGAFAMQPVATVSCGALAAVALVLRRWERRRHSPRTYGAFPVLLGLSAAILAIAAKPSISPPMSFAVPVVLLAAPLALVVRSSPIPDRPALAPVTALTTVLAVLAGRDLLPLVVALAGTVVVVIFVVTRQREAAPRPRRWGTKHWIALAAAGLGATIPAAIALAAARAPASAGASLARSALDAAGTADAEATVVALGDAQRHFRRAKARLNLPGASLGLAVPGMATNVEGARALVALGEHLAGAGVELATASQRLGLRAGGVELAELRALEPVLARAAAVADGARDRLRHLTPELLAGPLRDAVAQLEQRLDDDVRALHLTAGAARHLPAILGGDEPRHYFLAFQANGELRGSGGFMGSWGEIEASSGRLRLTRFAQLFELNRAGVRPKHVTLPDGFREQWGGVDVQQFWEWVNVSPDFPTTARLIMELYPQSGGRPLDGVIALDAPGIASLLQVTGPVSVPGWPEPISSANVVDVTLRTAAEHFPSDAERQAFLADVVRRVVDAFISSHDGADARAVVQALASAVGGNHLLVHLARPDEQALVKSAGADGAVPALLGDSLLVVNQNVGGNKTDLFLSRRIAYQATLRPRGDYVDIDGTLEVRLHNDAPASGLSEGLIGPYDSSRFAPGENRSWVAVYTALDAASADHEGGYGARRARDLDRWVHSSTIGIPSGQTRTVRLALEGRIRMDADGWYRLDVLHQTSMIPDDVEVVLDVPPPWHIAAAEGVSRWDSRKAVFRRHADEPATIAVRIVRDGAPSAWSRLWDPSSSSSGPGVKRSAEAPDSPRRWCRGGRTCPRNR